MQPTTNNPIDHTESVVLNIVMIGCSDSGKSEVAGLFYHYNENLLRNSWPYPIPSDRYYPRKYSPHFIALRCSRDYYVSANMRIVPFKSSAESYSLLQLIDCGAICNYMKNQLGGISMANVAILMVNCCQQVMNNQNIQELKNQLIATRVHQIKEYIVCVTGMDICNYDETEFNRFVSMVEPIFEEVLERKLSSCTIIPTSSFSEDNLLKHSQNIKWYSGPTLFESIQHITKTINIEKYSTLRFIVIRVMRISGIGNILYGKLQCGTLRKGQHLKIPLRDGTFISRQVIDLEVFYKKVDHVDSGFICGVDVGSIPLNEVKRGFIVSEEGLDQLKPVISFEAKIALRFGVKGFRIGATPVVNCSLQHISCRINSIQEQKNVKIVSMTPLKLFFMETHTENGGFLGRIILRENGNIIGYGKVVKVFY